MRAVLDAVLTSWVGFQRHGFLCGLENSFIPSHQSRVSGIAGQQVAPLFSHLLHSPRVLGLRCGCMLSIRSRVSNTNVLRRSQGAQKGVLSVYCGKKSAESASLSCPHLPDYWWSSFCRTWRDITVFRPPWLGTDSGNILPLAPDT